MRSQLSQMTLKPRGEPMPKRDYPFLVIDGEGISTKRDLQPEFAVVPRPRPAPALQLGLLGLGASRSSVVSVGLDALQGDDFEALLHAEGIRHIADIRVSPTFRGQIGAAVERILASSTISYHYFPELSDRFIGFHGTPWEHRQRYFEHLQGCQAGLERLRRLVHDGPLLLLSWEPKHPPSDRALVLEALRALNTEFTLRVAGNDQA